MLTLKVGQCAPLTIDPAGIAKLNKAAVKFVSSDERVCTVKPDGTGTGCTVYASDGGIDMQAQVLVYCGEDVISAEDISVFDQDKPLLAVSLVAGVAVEAP